MYIEKDKIPTVWTVSMIFVITGVLKGSDSLRKHEAAWDTM